MPKARSTLVTRAPNIIDKDAAHPTFLVFGLTRRITAHRIQNQPPFPRNVIIFITGVRISDRRYCWIRSRSSSSRFCIECKILIYTLLLNQHSPLPLFIFLQTIQLIPFYSCCYLRLPAPNICLMQNAPALPKISQHKDAFLPLLKTFVTVPYLHSYKLSIINFSFSDTIPVLYAPRSASRSL